MTSWPFGDLHMFRYEAILADPPWRMKMYSEKGKGRSPDGRLSRAESRTNNPARHYETMTVAEIKALPVNHLAARDCALFLWAIDPLLPEAIEVGRAWGFEFKTIAFVWAKQRRETSRRAKDMEEPAHKMFPMGTGYWTRANPEVCLLFTRGQPRRLSASIRKLVVAPRREHSRKPDRIRCDIEALCSGPYCELFARQPRVGWDTWGNETGKFEEAA